MDIYHLPTHKIDDTYLGVEHQHTYPSFPNRLADKIESMKKASDLAMSSSLSTHSLIPRRSSLSRPRSLTSSSSPMIRPLHKETSKLTTQSPLDTYSHLFESSASLKRISRAELESIDYNEPLATSFSTFQHSSIGIQADGLPLMRHTFKDLRETRTWTNNVVDPFLTDLRAAIIKNRPCDLQEYCAAYCNNVAKGCPPPETQGQSTSNISPVIVGTVVSSANEGKNKVKRKDASIIHIRGGNHSQIDSQPFSLFQHHHHSQQQPHDHNDDHNDDGDNDHYQNHDYRDNENDNHILKNHHHHHHHHVNSGGDRA